MNGISPAQLQSNIQVVGWITGNPDINVAPGAV